MTRTIKAGIIGLACFGMSAFAQDWYHDRDTRFQGEQWRGHVFEQVRMDLDHINSAYHAAERERRRLAKTREELANLQDKLNHSRYDGGELNDVIDSLRKSADDQRLSERDRSVLRDDVARLEDYRNNHDHWKR